MPFFSQETLEAVRAIPLYEIVRPVVELSRSGRNWKGLSPFSQEKTPSFFVLTDKNFFKCHSSGLAGDGIRFVQETEKLTFPEAVEALAERFNIPVKYAGGTQPAPEARSLKQALLDIHDYARDYYHRAFMHDHPSAESVRRYWVEQRGFPLSLADEFQIGFSPPASRRLLELLLEKGFSREALAKCGLFHPGQQESRPETWFFTFRGRLMIPIRDIQGQVVAFTARQLDVTPKDHASWQAKYINSPETPLFKKSRLLFNLDRAKDVVKTTRRFLLVEGQLDALRCWSAGLQEAVAPQGTSITEEQLSLIRRYTDSLDVLMDSDAAGGKAVLRLLPMAFKEGLEVHVYSLPQGLDPDDYIRQKGAAGLKDLPRRTGIRFAGETLLGEEPPSPEHRAKVLHALFQMLAACPSAVVREGYFHEAVEATGAPVRAAREDFQRLFQPTQPAASSPAAAPARRAISPETLTNLEGDLIWSVFINVGWADSLAQVIDHQWIKASTPEGRLLSRILNHASVDHLRDRSHLVYLLESDEERDCWHRWATEERPTQEMEIFVNQTVQAMARRYCKERVNQLDQEIARSSPSETDMDRIRDLMKERQELTRYLRNGPFPQVAPPQPHD